jgi:hypothetical protein
MFERLMFQVHRLAIIPMKLQALSNRNAKKDYWDIAALLNHSLEDILSIFKTKFP